MTDLTNQNKPGTSPKRGTNFLRSRTRSKHTLSDVFAKNTRYKLKNNRHHINCRLGLWGVSGSDLKTVQAEAMHYFQQYWNAGEYNGTIKQKIFNMIRGD